MCAAAWLRSDYSKELNVLEALGLILALLDFFNLTHRVENLLDRVRHFYLRVFNVLRVIVIHDDAQETLTPAEARIQWIFFGGMVCLVLLCSLAMSVGAFHDAQEQGGGIRNWIMWLVISLGFPPVLLIFSFICIILPLSAFYYGLLLPLAWLVRLIDLPPRGTVGTIGLLLALAGFYRRMTG
jgi:hypothetical protein